MNVVLKLLGDTVHTRKDDIFLQAMDGEAWALTKAAIIDVVR